MNRRQTLQTLGTSLMSFAIPTTAFAAALGSSNGTLEPQLAMPELAHVDPELRPAAARIIEMSKGRPPLTIETMLAMRATVRNEPPIADVPWLASTVPSMTGQPDVAVHLVNFDGNRQRGAIVYMHGGGFFAGTSLMRLRRSQELARTLDCAILSVDYRLAPETRFSESIEDNYAALRWLHRHAAHLGVDPGRLVLLGESAGGGHAALLAQSARDRGEIPVAFQCLVYPVLDDRTGSVGTIPSHVGAFGWTAEQNRFAWTSFLGREPGRTDRIDGVPGRTVDLIGLPPAWIGVGGIDILVGEDIAYATRLLDAGVPTELLVVPGAFHGFDNLGAETDVAQRFTASKIAALRRALT